MRIVVNHLTRMAAGYICVAGVDPNARHIRLLGYSRLDRRLLRDQGGPIELGGLLDIGSATPVGKPPEVEDHRIEPRRIRRERTVTPAEFWEVLIATAAPSLTAIFGSALTPAGAACRLPAGQGEASLGCLRVTGTIQLYLRARPSRPAQVRLRFGDGTREVDASVTDLRLFRSEPDDWLPDPARVNELTGWLAASSEMILSVGLSRPYAADPDAPEMHWLQVNNIHIAEAPLWPRPLP